MDLTSLTSPAGVLALLPTAALLVLFALVTVRTKSRHTVQFRLWQLAHGNREISDPLVRAYVEQQNDLMSFRFITGMRVKTLVSARELIQWTDLGRAQISELREAGEYFDPDLRQVRSHKLPSIHKQFVKIGFCLILAAGSLGVASLITSENALISLNQTGRYLWLDAEEARPLWPHTKQPLTKGLCADQSNNALRQTSFNEVETRIVCAILADAGTPAYVKATVSEQRAFAPLVLLIELILFTWSVWSSYRSGQVARKLMALNLDPSLADEQLELPFSEEKAKSA